MSDAISPIRPTVALLVLALTTLGVGQALAQPTSQERDTAAQLVFLGDERRAAGDHEAALKAYQQADNIMGVPTTGIEVARELVALGQLKDARKVLQRVAAHPHDPDEPEAFGRAREEAASMLEEIEGQPGDDQGDEDTPRVRGNAGESCVTSGDCVEGLGCIQGVCGGRPSVAGDEDADGAEHGAAGGLPIAYARRPLTLPALMVAPEFSAATTREAAFGFSAYALDLGVAFGVTNDLTVETMPLSFYFGDPAADYGAFRLAAIYRFLGGDVAEMGAKLRFYMDSDGFLALNPGLPVRIHGGDVLRIDTGVNFNIFFSINGGDPLAALSDLDRDPFPSGPFMLPASGVPLDLAFQIVDFFWAGLSTGFGIADFADAADTIFVPLGVELGGTIPGEERALVDITAGFQFPQFVATGHPETIYPDLFSGTVNAKVYIGP